MNRGKWYLVYTWQNWMEAGTFRDGIEEKEIPLNATTEDEAIAEAQAKWKGIIAEAKAWWEKQQAEWKHPPQAIFDDVPPCPRIIYKFPLPESQ